MKVVLWEDTALALYSAALMYISGRWFRPMLYHDVPMFRSHVRYVLPSSCNDAVIDSLSTARSTYHLSSPTQRKATITNPSSSSNLGVDTNTVRTNQSHSPRTTEADTTSTGCTGRRISFLSRCRCLRSQERSRRRSLFLT